MPDVKEPVKSSARTARTARTAPAGTEIIKKICKNCGEEFDTHNLKKETRPDKCRSDYSRKRTIN